MGHTVLFTDVFLHRFHQLSGIVYVVTLRQPHIHHDLRPCRRREETLLDELETPQGCCKHTDDNGQGHELHPDADTQKGLVHGIETATIGIGAFVTPGRFLQEHHTQQRCDRHGRHPAE